MFYPLNSKAMKNTSIALLSLIITSCHFPEAQTQTKHQQPQILQPASQQISPYVVDVFQDTKGNLWFGTLEDGVARYDGMQLTYLTTKDGLPSDRIVTIIEDSIGNIWFGTGAGLSKYDGQHFTNYSEKDGLCSDMISNLLIDSQGTFWIGTWGGVCTFHENQFEKIELPIPKIKTIINPDTKEWNTALYEDSKGNIWIGRDGYGAIKSDGMSMVHFTTEEGLNSNNVQSIAEDKEGHIWIGTRVAEKDNADPSHRIGPGGLNKYSGHQFIHFPELIGLYENDVYAIYKNHSDALWISTTSHGVYKITNTTVVNYAIPLSTMSFCQDLKGNMWLGCAGGLYKINQQGEIINITTDGPW
jgi:ligand-binding sensor domain-containing protein